MTYTQDHMYNRLKVDYDGLPTKSLTDMLEEWWTLAGYPDGSLGNDQKEAFYRSQGATGASMGDLEYDYWFRVGPNIMAAMGAVFAIDAAQTTPGEQWVLNRGSGGQVLRAGYGSVRRAEIRNGVGLVNVGRVAGSSVFNYAQVPFSSALVPTGDVEYVVRVAMDQWATYNDTANMGIMGRFSGGASTNSSGIGLTQGSRRLTFYHSDGTSGTVTQSSAQVPFTDGEMAWIRISWRLADGRTQFFTAPDSTDVPTNWTQLGSNVFLRAGIPLNAGTDEMRIGGTPNAAFYANGVFGRAIYRTAIGGPNVVDVDFTTQPDLTTSFVCSTGQTVTVTAVNAVDTNDPLLLPWTGENYVRCQAAGGSLSTPAKSVFDNSSQLDLRVCMGNLESGRVRIVATRGNTAPASSSFRAVISGGNTLRLDVSDGTAYVSSTISGFIPTQYIGENAPPVGLRWVFNSGVVEGYYKPVSAASALADISNHSGWILIGTTTNALTTFYPSSLTLGWGGFSVASSSGSNDAFYAGWVSSVINGAPVTSFTTNVANESLLVTEQSDPITLVRATSGRKYTFVTRPIWLFGTDDYLEVNDNDLLDIQENQQMTFIVVRRSFNGVPYAAANVLISKRATTSNTGGSPGWVIVEPTSQSLWSFRTDNGTSPLARGAGVVAPPGTVEVMSGTLDATNASAGSNNTLGGGAARLSGDYSNTLPMRIGTFGSTTYDGEILAVGVFRRALSAAEIARIVSAYGAA